MQIGVIKISRDGLETPFECEHQKFENEEAALAYAAKVAALKPGDHVLFMKDGQARRAVFQAHVDEGGVRIMAYDPETKEITPTQVCTLRLRFPEMH